MLELFKTFLFLGCVSFGGPAAHIGYFRRAFVEKRQWLSEQEFAQLIAFSQFLPGPGSSQIGFAIGYQRHGILGGIFAFLGFTLPSILLMITAATLSATFLQTEIWQSLIHGLKLLAVVVVADATLTMYRHFCQTKLGAILAALTACFTLAFPSISSQIICLIIAAIAGNVFSSKATKLPEPHHLNQINRKNSLEQWVVGFLFLCLLFILPWFSHQLSALQLFSEFFQAGSLVFGGGHVVLPLLQNILAEQVNTQQFLTGYAMAQAVPGPMFTLATYLGYFLLPAAPLAGSIIATFSIFLPGFLLVILFYSRWCLLANRPIFIYATLGVNAAVVGLLLAALYQPVFTSAVFNSIDIIWVILGLLLLRIVKLPIIFIVIGYVLFSLLSYYI